MNKTIFPHPEKFSLLSRVRSLWFSTSQRVNYQTIA